METPATTPGATMETPAAAQQAPAPPASSPRWTAPQSAPWTGPAVALNTSSYTPGRSPSPVFDSPEEEPTAAGLQAAELVPAASDAATSWMASAMLSGDDIAAASAAVVAGAATTSAAVGMAVEQPTDEELLEDSQDTPGQVIKQQPPPPPRVHRRSSEHGPGALVETAPSLPRSSLFPTMNSPATGAPPAASPSGGLSAVFRSVQGAGAGEQRPQKRQRSVETEEETEEARETWCL